MVALKKIAIPPGTDASVLPREVEVLMSVNGPNNYHCLLVKPCLVRAVLAS